MIRLEAYPSLGHQLLHRLTTRPRTISPSELSKVLDVGDNLISRYRGGGPVPDHIRSRLVGLGIPLAAWDDHQRPDAELDALEGHTPRDLPQAAWDLQPDRAPVPPPPPIEADYPPVESLGIEGLQQLIQRGLREAANLPATDQLWSRIAAWQVQYARLQQQQPIEDAPPDIDRSKLDYAHQALLRAADNLSRWLASHPGQVPPAVPKVAARMCVVDGLRGAALGVLDPEGFVSLVSPVELDSSAVRALVAAGWVRPVRPRGLYEHENESEIDPSPVFAVPPEPAPSAE